MSLISNKTNLSSSSSEFQELTLKLKRDKEAGWQKLFQISKILFSNWKNEEKIEMMWTLDNNKLPVSVESVYQSIFLLVKEAYKHKLPDFTDNNDIKTFIRPSFDSYLNKTFKSFYQALFLNIQIVWTVFHNLMYVLLQKMIYCRQKMHPEDANDICSISILTFRDNIYKKNLDFENSKKLKSYVYVIAFNKLSEYFKAKIKKNKLVDIDEYANNIIDTVNFSQAFEDTDLTEQLLALLEEEEYEIIVRHYYYGIALKEIAEEMGKTPENIRIIKYRALNKLRDFLNLRNLNKTKNES